MDKLVLASGNAGKLKELSSLLTPLGIEVLPQSAFNVSEAEEPHPSFVENAIAKARHAARATGLPALADDSGLCVDVLGGAPGVLSARFAGEPKSDARNNALLLERLAGEPNRRARFYCALALVRHADDPQPIIACGEWHGEILEATRGRAHDQTFIVVCSAASHGVEARGEGRSRRAAEQEAARLVLERLSAEHE